MAFPDIADAKSIVRLKVEDRGRIVFPISARGKAATAEGVFEKIAATDPEGKRVGGTSVLFDEPVFVGKSGIG